MKTFLIIFSLLLPACFVFAAELPLLQPAPVLTGHPGGAGWEKALTVQFERRKAVARIGRSADFLFVSVESEHGCPEESVSNVTEHDGDVFADDCLDLFIDASGQRKDFYQIIANTRGVIFDHYRDELGRTRKSWDSGATAAGSYKGNSFYIEMAVPLAALAPQGGGIGLAIACYTRWNLFGDSVFGKYHRPETWTRFDISGSYPLALIATRASSFGGRQPYEFDLKNRTEARLELTGDINGQALQLAFEPGESQTLKVFVQQQTGVAAENRLRLFAGEHEVLRYTRRLTPKPLLTVVPVSDIVYHDEPVRLRINVHEPQTTPVTVEFCQEQKQASCTYKDATVIVPFETIPSPWR